MCHGHKVRRGSTQITVTLERGMADGDDIRFEREGDQSPDATPGDVVFEVKVQPHALFERKGDHLYLTETISLKEALLGFSHTLKHLDGRDFVIEQKGVTQPGLSFINSASFFRIHINFKR